MTFVTAPLGPRWCFKTNGIEKKELQLFGKSKYLQILQSYLNQHSYTWKTPTPKIWSFLAKSTDTSFVQPPHYRPRYWVGPTRTQNPKFKTKFLHAFSEQKYFLNQRKHLNFSVDFSFWQDTLQNSSSSFTLSEETFLNDLQIKDFDNDEKEGGQRQGAKILFWFT